jgi:hypothetical protein
MDLNGIRKSNIFLGRVTKYSLKNRPDEALKRGLAGRMRRNWGGRRRPPL